MPSLEAKRTLVKSPPEIWAEVSDAGALARHLGEFGEIRITRTQPESVVEWEGDLASGCVRLEPSGWGTRGHADRRAGRRAGARARARAGAARPSRREGVVVEPLPAPPAEPEPVARARARAAAAGARARRRARVGRAHRRARHARRGAPPPVLAALDAPNLRRPSSTTERRVLTAPDAVARAAARVAAAARAALDPLPAARGAAVLRRGGASAAPTRSCASRSGCCASRGRARELHRGRPAGAGRITCARPMRQKSPETYEEKLAQLEELRDAAIHHASEAAVEKQHAKGKYTARERIEKLLDPGSFQELDTYVRHRTTEFEMQKNRPWGDAVVTGHGTIDGRRVCVFSPGLHGLRRLAGRGHGREDVQDHGPGGQDRLPRDRHQRLRRRPHPGGRRLARRLRRRLRAQRPAAPA